MRPVDNFLRSVRDAFQPSSDAPVWLWITIAFCLSAAIAWALIQRRRVRLASVRAFAQFLAHRKLSEHQARHIGRLANRAGVEPRVVASQIDAFERATALELAEHKPSPTDGDAGIFAEIAALRSALGFERIAGHFALLTTRELVDGQIVAVAGSPATVVEVNEGCFAVAAPAAQSFPVGPIGSLVRLTLIHGQEARYETRCALLAKQSVQATQKLIFGHDERPIRIQLRKTVRVTVRGPVRVNPIVAPGGVPEPAVPTALEVGQAHESQDHDHDQDQDQLGVGSLLDISVGGAALDVNIHVPVGALVHLSFELDTAPYHDILALVLECQERRGGAHHMRLEFHNLPRADEQQLAASIARYSARPFTQEP